MTVEQEEKPETRCTMIVTVFDRDIPTVVEALQMLPFLPEGGLLKLGTFDAT